MASLARLQGQSLDIPVTSVLGQSEVQMSHKRDAPLFEQKSSEVGEQIFSLNKKLQHTQSEVFLRAFEVRFKVSIPPEGRENFRTLAALGKLKTVMKYALAQPMAALTRYGGILEMPKAPEDYSEYSGFGRFLIMDVLKLNSTQRMRLYSRLTETVVDPLSKERKPSTRAIKSCFELTQMKNICPNLTFFEVVESIKDHHDTLTDSRNPEVPDSVKDIVETVSNIIFPQLILYRDLPPGKLTDRAALIESSLFEDGLGHDVENGLITQRLISGSGFKKTISDQPEALSSDLAFGFLEKMVYSPKVGTQEVYSYGRREFEEETLLRPFLDTTKYPVTENSAQIVALLEPLKVRTISVDSGILRYLASRLQKYLWGRLASYPIFDLIRGVPVEQTIDFFVSNIPFVSGDYKGATDSIFHNSTAQWVDQIFKRLVVPSELRDHFEAIRRDFTSVILDYSLVYNQEGFKFLQGMGWDPKSKVPGNFHANLDEFNSQRNRFGLPPIMIPKLLEENTRVRQARGQLMGNVLSFPILCLINLTGYLHAASEYMDSFKEDFSDPSTQIDRAQVSLLADFFRWKGGSYELCLNKQNFPRLPVRVNGDDILFQASPFFYRVWSHSLKDVGFVKSVGKNYYSPWFFTVNSQIFIPQYSDEGEPGVPFRHEPSRLNHIWWSGLSPEYLRRRTDFAALVGQEDSRIADSRSFLRPVQEYFLSTVSERDRKIWNDLFLQNNREFIDSFDVYPTRKVVRDGKSSLERIPNSVPLFRVSRSLPVVLGGLGLILNEPEELTYSQKVLAGRLNLEGRHAPFALGVVPLIKELIGFGHQVFSRELKIISMSPLDADLALLEGTHEKLSSRIIRLTTELFPMWRTPPPDDLRLRRDEIEEYSSKMFRWAMKCRRSLKQSFVENVITEPPNVEMVSI